MLDHEVNEFGRRLGLSHLELGIRGLICLKVADVGVLFLERKGETLFVTLAEEGQADVESVKKLLAAVNWRKLSQMVVYAGLAKGRRLIVTRLHADTVTASGLENTVRQLMTTLKSAT